MSGISGLKKGQRPDIEEQAKAFIDGVNYRTKKVSANEKSVKKYKRYTFSLTEEVSKSIDEITFLPNDFKVNRSEVVKAGISLLHKLERDELLAILKGVK